MLCPLPAAPVTPLHLVLLPFPLHPLPPPSLETVPLLPFQEPSQHVHIYQGREARPLPLKMAAVEDEDEEVVRPGREVRGAVGTGPPFCQSKTKKKSLGLHFDLAKQVSSARLRNES